MNSSQQWGYNFRFCAETHMEQVIIFLSANLKHHWNKWSNQTEMSAAYYMVGMYTIILFFQKEKKRGIPSKNMLKMISLNSQHQIDYSHVIFENQHILDHSVVPRKILNKKFVIFTLNVEWPGSSRIILIPQRISIQNLRPTVKCLSFLFNFLRLASKLINYLITYNR